MAVNSKSSTVIDNIAAQTGNIARVFGSEFINPAVNNEKHSGQAKREENGLEDELQNFNGDDKIVSADDAVVLVGIQDSSMLLAQAETGAASVGAGAAGGGAAAGAGAAAAGAGVVGAGITAGMLGTIALGVGVAAAASGGGSSTPAPVTDTTAPAVALTAATDDIGTVTGALISGASTDDTALLLSGTNEAGATVNVFNGATLLGAATVVGTTWSYSATVVDGTTYEFNAKATDAAGNTSAATANFTVIGDTTAPAVALTAATDDIGTVTGALISGASTDDTALLLSGTNEAGATVNVFNGATLLGAATVVGTTWSYSATVVDGTTYEFNAKATDAAGNTSAATANFTVIGDTTAPTVALTAATDDIGTVTGALISGASTDDTALLLSGTNEAGATVNVFNGATLLGAATVVGTTWSYSATVVDGTTYQFNAKATDAAGNTSAATANFTVIGDTTAPAATVSIDLVFDNVGSITGALTTGGVSNDTALLLSGTITGTLGTGEVVAVYDNGIKLGTATVSGSDWSYSDSTLANGNAVSYTVRVEDAAGNQGALSAAFTTTIDTTAPTATVTLADSSLIAGETSLVTFTFSEAVSGFALADVTAPNGSFGTLSAATDNLDGTQTYTATFTPTASVEDTTNAISINLTGLTDLAGNAGTGTAASANFAVDTLLPTATVTLADSALIAGETSLVTFTFSEAVSGFALADVTAPNGSFGTLSAATNNGDGTQTYTATFTPIADVEDTTNAISIDLTGLADIAGNAGTGTAASANYTVDTLLPTATVTLADSALIAGETSLVTFTFGQAVSGFALADVTAPNGSFDALATLDNITFTATFTPDANIEDATNAISINLTGVTDTSSTAAGVGTADSANYAVDTLLPTATVTLADSALIAGDTSLVTFTFGQAVSGFSLADVTAPNGSFGTLSAATDNLDGTQTYTATFTPTASVEDATNAISIDLTGVTDTSSTAAGVGTAASANYAVDTLAPTITGASFTETGDPTESVSLVFSEAVALTNVNGLTLTKNIFTAVTNGADSVLGDTVTVATNVDLIATDYVRAQYVASAGNLTDLAGNAVASTDIFFGGSGDNTIDLSSLNTSADIYGNAGIDILIGSSAADRIYGGIGDDTITGGAGADTISGGADADVYVYAAGDSNSTDMDSISGYETQEVIDHDTLTASQASASTEVAGTAGLVGDGSAATFNVADVSLAERISAVELAVRDVTNTAGEAAHFQFESDSYVFITDGVDGVGANDTLIKLTGIDSTNAAFNELTIAGGNLYLA
jgi:hypothetical protein